MEAKALRRIFLNFYKERGHIIVPSSSLVPKDDPTLLFTTAGMVQFKPLYAGAIPLPYKRATSCQKCLRLSDLEKVGFSPKYCTFFEMLGNFSFGDYFKKEALIWAWELLTEVFKIDKKRLYVSVFKEDDEAYNIWHKVIGLEEKRIYRLGEEDNFWGPAGGVGACGPSSEIYYDLGEEFGCQKATCGPGCSCERFLELYNIVFPMYDQQPDGKRLPLKNRGIDTGMGLERLAMVVQNKKTIFETDLFAFLIDKIMTILPGTEDKKPFYYITADHMRALTFAIADGVLPANEGRGYVLRLLLRRVLIYYYKFFKQLPEKPFLYLLPSEICENYGDFYPELKENVNKIPLIIKEEEERFLLTLKKAISKWEEVVSKAKLKKERILTGDTLFFLHDTFGLNIEIMEELAKEENLLLDKEGFLKRLNERKRVEQKPLILISKGEPINFVGYQELVTESEVVYFQKVSDDEYELSINPTPFYCEKGGQVGDWGKIVYNGEEFPVVDSYYRYGVPIQKIKTNKEVDLLFKKVRAEVDKERREEISRAHTATHLLHRALKEVLGKEVRQEGSLVDCGRLTFDFNFFRPLKKEELRLIEEVVFSKILENLKVEKYFSLPLEEAKKMGAIALFLEEYGPKVNVIKIGDFSIEVCGGTHVDYTSEIALFKIVDECGVKSGIRRISAYCGKRAYLLFVSKYERVERIKAELKTTEEEIIKKIKELNENLKEKERKRNKLIEHLLPLLKKNLSGIKMKELEVIIEDFSFLEKDEIRRLCDLLKKESNKLAIFLKKNKERVEFIILSTAKFSALKLAKALGNFLEGGGGGRNDLAEGGGKLKSLSEIKAFIFKEISLWQ
uniref:Alanine--tRNA ligase n=1 Tax=candidate division WOR-3 bacterium TaxID=2052148 RepID=A0A7V5Y0M8_UNCW3